MRNSRVALCASLAWFALLTLIVLREVPQGSKDVHAYLQGWAVWPAGQQTFTASLFGSRHLTVAYYGLFLWLFGPSADSLSMALATLFALNSVMILLACFAVLRHWPQAAIVAGAINLVSCCLRSWYTPLSEAPFTAANTLLLLLWVRYAVFPPAERRQSLGALALIGIAAGLFSQIRLGNAVFIGAICVTLLLFRHLLPRTDGRSGAGAQPTAVVCLGLLAAFALGSAASFASWSLWARAPRPPQLYASLFFHRTIEHCGHARNGPLTRQLLTDMQAPDEYVRYWELLAFVFRKYGPAKADLLMKDVAFEALRACGGPTTKRTLDSFVEYLTLPLYRSRGLRLSTDDKIAELRRGLERAVGERARQGALYHVEGSASMAEIADRRIPMLSTVRRLFPDVRYVIDPPGAVFVLELGLVCVLWIARKSELVALWLPVCLYALGMIAIASFSKEVLRRFLDPFVPSALLVLLATPVSLYNERRRMRARRSGIASETGVLPIAC